MHSATKDLMLPTTVTGSWPRPTWYTGNLHERSFTSGMADVAYREQHVDAVSALLSDQEFAGLDILTTGDYHLDNELGGRSWFWYPAERLAGISSIDAEITDPKEDQVEATPSFTFPVGTYLHEIISGWKYPAVIDKVGVKIPLEFAKIWRVAQARTEKPVKFGTISADFLSTVFTLHTDVYADDKRELMWEIASVLNGELRQLAAAGCKAIQIEQPAIHSAAALGGSADELDFFVDLFNHTVEGLDGVEVWAHTCWGNPGAQMAYDPDISYEPSIDIYLNRVNADVWTIESKDSGHKLLPSFAPYRSTLNKKIAVGFISHRTLQVETATEVAADVRHALQFIDPEFLVLSSDCGFGRQGVPRPIALYKAAALAQGANIVRSELGLSVEPVPAAELSRQIDAPLVTSN
jgi:5-methyltetrahydropteroyltriglutamate--homocysteine methyltransferase